MEKVAGFGQYEHRQVLRRRPVKHVLQGDDFVGGAVHQQGAFGLGRARGGGAVFVVAEGGADKQQQIGLHALGGEGGDVAAEGKAGQRQQRRFGVALFRPLGQRGHVVALTGAVVVRAFAVAGAARIGQVAVKAELGERFGSGLRDFVGKGAALQRVGMVYDGDTARRALGGDVEVFDLAGGAGSVQQGVGLQHGKLSGGWV